MQIQQGVSLRFIETDKFKDIGVSIRFKCVLEKKKAAARSLLALMLCDRSRKYDTKKKMSDHLDTMYGAILSAQTAGYGKAQVVELRSKIINPSYLEESNTMMEDLFAFLHEILFEPLLDKDVFEESKLILAAKVERMQDDPAQYAITQGLKLAGEGAPLGISALGEAETVRALTLEDIRTVYHEMIEEDEITIIVCGDLREEEIRGQIEKYLNFCARKNTADTYYTVQTTPTSQVVKDYKNISQSSIMMVWFTNTSLVDEDYYALRVANAMFGQYSTSLLFQEVREKNSLCYSIFSNLISYDGALGVTTGVEQEHIDQTITLIRKQFETLCKGDFDEELLKVSKQMIISSLKASKDAMNSLIALEYQNELLGCQRSTEDIIALVEKVTAEDVIRAIGKCEEKMTFILTKEDDNETNHE